MGREFQGYPSRITYRLVVVASCCTAPLWSSGLDAGPWLRIARVGCAGSLGRTVLIWFPSSMRHDDATSPESEHVTRRRRLRLSPSEASAGMVVARVVVRPPDVVFVKGILEASEGVAGLFAERGGELTLAAPRDRGQEL